MNLNNFINASGKNNRKDFSLLLWCWAAYKSNELNTEYNFLTFKSRIAYTLTN